MILNKNEVEGVTLGRVNTTVLAVMLTLQKEDHTNW